VPFIYVDGIDGVVAEIEANGGAILQPVYAEEALWVATFRDPAGNVIGLWSSGAR
jgi:predicted enzyme related to lactoylglutathione lyase